MGLMTAQSLAEFGDAGLVAHLSSNCFPPMGVMIDVAREALAVAEAAQPFEEGFLFEDVLDQTLDTPLPEGWTWRGRDRVTAREMLDGLNLIGFIDFAQADGTEVE